MVIFYTMGIARKTDNFYDLPPQFYQLIYSVYSIRKQWGIDDKIIIYTNFKKPFIKMFMIDPNRFVNIEYRDIPVDYQRYTHYYSTYGHTRNYLTYDLLVELKDMVIYLDPDTGIRATCGPKSRKVIMDLDVPHLYRRELYNPFRFWSGKTLHDVIDFEKELGIPNDSVAINNGVMIFPYNNIGVKSAYQMGVMYDYVYERILEGIKRNILNEDDVCFADMFSASIVYYQMHWKTLYSDDFYNVDINGMIPADQPHIPIIHYYNSKTTNPPSRWEVVRLRMLEYVSNTFDAKI